MPENIRQMWEAAANINEGKPLQQINQNTTSEPKQRVDNGGMSVKAAKQGGLRRIDHTRKITTYSAVTPVTLPTPIIH